MGWPHCPSWSHPGIPFLSASSFSPVLFPSLSSGQEILFVFSKGQKCLENSFLFKKSLLSATQAAERDHQPHSTAAEPGRSFASKVSGTHDGDLGAEVFWATLNNSPNLCILLSAPSPQGRAVCRTPKNHEHPRNNGKQHKPPPPKAITRRFLPPAAAHTGSRAPNSGAY